MEIGPGASLPLIGDNVGVRYVLTRRHPPTSRILVVESGPRHVLERLLPALDRNYPEVRQIDILKSGGGGDLMKDIFLGQCKIWKFQRGRDNCGNGIRVDGGIFRVPSPRRYGDSAERHGRTAAIGAARAIRIVEEPPFAGAVCPANNIFKADRVAAQG